MEPPFQVVEDGFGSGLPGLHPLVGRLAPDVLFHAIEFGDAFYGLLSNGRSLGFVNIDELTPDMGHASDFGNFACTVKIIEPGIAVGMHEAFVGCQMFPWSNTLPVRREPIPRGGMRLTGPGPFITDIGPKPCGSGFTGAWGQQLYRRIICEEGLSPLNMVPNGP